MTIENFIGWLSIDLIEFKKFRTLGGRSEFRAKYDTNNGSISITNSKQRSYTLKNDAIVEIFERCKNAPLSQRYMSSYYLLPPNKEKYLKGEYTTEYWVDPPDKVATPAIPAVIKYWVNNDLLCVESVK